VNIINIRQLRRCVLIGTPDDRVGEEVKVYIVLKEGYEGKITEG